MNKTILLEKLSEVSGVGIDDCGKVTDALELVFEERLKSSKGLSDVFNKFSELIIYVSKIKNRTK